MQADRILATYWLKYQTITDENNFELNPWRNFMLPSRPNEFLRDFLRFVDMEE